MRKQLFFFFLLLFIFRNVNSQTEFDNSAMNHVFIEFAGLGGFGSVNYERVFININKSSFTARMGLGFYNIRDFTNKINPDLNFPIALCFLYGQSSKVELGLGQSFSSIVYYDKANSNRNRQLNSHSTLSIAYRYHLQNYGVIIRCAYNPILEFNKYFRHWFGLSVGYSF